MEPEAINTFQYFNSNHNVTDIYSKSGCDLLNRVNNMFKNYTPKTVIDITCIETDLGMMIAAATGKGICMLEFADCKLLELELRQLAAFSKAPLVRGENIYFDILREQIYEYFRGERKNFDIPVYMIGTEFQKQVWLSLLKIPYGCTTSYKKQAELLGMPSAVRAVANANGKNKISVILPCHRVIGTDGALTGYGGGIWRKKKLLELEKDNTPAK
ncbi:MAG: methylated-DNA--[protein]-cysteine S-methyltransferase [Bacteroidales bacterium]|jgi:AraC family transcriptional regulator of adaptative response/methylated-DNA-[protein]-cysteine methyltransferase|nr:methylated-DNA--[protein]-cysteine S-methyltransferase [Bacteroidales bacterium]